MIGTIADIGIDCLTATVSKTRMTVAERCAGLLTEKKAARLVKNTGFTHLSVAAPGICTSDFCVEAAERLFATTAKKEDIGGVIFISQTPDYPAPATSYIIQHRLGLSNDIMAFDISLGCSGFVYGVYVAASMLSNMQRKVLLLVGDNVKDFMPGDISGRAINGAAGAAAIIGHRKIKKEQNMLYNITSYGEKYGIIICPRGGARNPKITDEKGNFLAIQDNFGIMDGAEVMNFSAYETYGNVQSLFSHFGVNGNDLNYAFLHQANFAIVDALRERLGFTPEQAPFASDETGNTSSASIPVCMAEMKRRGKYTPPKKALLSGFGVGMSVASIVMDLSETIVLETGAL
ncbi:MAG: hypothetical protein K6F37_01345 [Lachnospiraceae bacterium]|nr:hypothetical protein [Lachnospiraceae bacterium]